MFKIDLPAEAVGASTNNFGKETENKSREEVDNGRLIIARIGNKTVLGYKVGNQIIWAGKIFSLENAEIVSILKK